MPPRFIHSAEAHAGFFFRCKALHVQTAIGKALQFHYEYRKKSVVGYHVERVTVQPVLPSLQFITDI